MITAPRSRSISMRPWCTCATTAGGTSPPTAPSSRRSSNACATRGRWRRGSSCSSATAWVHLLIRSACAVAQAAGHAWLPFVRALAFIGAPHQGAPLERAGHGLHTLLTASPYTAAFGHLARLRSAGITDLRHGWVNDEDWIGHDRFAHARRPHRAHPLPDGIPAFAIAGSSSRRAPAHGKARGDGLVPVASALGRHADPALDLHIPAAHTAVVYRTGHLELLGSRAVYRRLQRWLAAALAVHASDRRRIAGGS